MSDREVWKEISKDVEAFEEVVKILEPLKPEQRELVVKAVIKKLKLADKLVKD